MVLCRPSARLHLFIPPYPSTTLSGLWYSAGPQPGYISTSIHTQCHSVWSMVLCRPSARLHLFIPPCPSTTLCDLWRPAGPQAGYISSSLHTPVPLWSMVPCWPPDRLHLFIPTYPSTTLSGLWCPASPQPGYISSSLHTPVLLCLVYGALLALRQATSLHPNIPQYHSVWSMVPCRPSGRLHLFIPPYYSTLSLVYGALLAPRQATSLHPSIPQYHSGLWCPAGPQAGYISSSLHTPIHSVWSMVPCWQATSLHSSIPHYHSVVLTTKWRPDNKTD